MESILLQGWVAGPSGQPASVLFPETHLVVLCELFFNNGGISKNPGL